MSSSTPRCSSCRRPVLWARTQRGARIPLDPAPTDDGTYELDLEAVPTPIARRLDRLDRALRRHAREPGRLPAYTCHLDTCPNRTPKGTT